MKREPEAMDPPDPGSTGATYEDINSALAAIRWAAASLRRNNGDGNRELAEAVSVIEEAEERASALLRSAQPAEGASETEGASVIPLTPLHVLIIDDEHLTRESVASQVKVLGHVPTTVDSSARAEQALSASRFDVVMMDTANGKDLAIRRMVSLTFHAARTGFPWELWVITPWPDLWEDVGLVKLGVWRCLRKPVTLDGLAPMLRLARRTRAQSLARSGET